MTTFKEIGVEADLVKAIEKLGFENPMPVQEKVIPELIKNNGRDLIALAQTGTGKTAAFGLPLIQNTDSSSKKVQYLILSPTRELCVQIANDLEHYSKYKKGVKVLAVFGGSSIENQIGKIKKGVHIISATPGRLLDLIKRKVVNLSKVQTVVLDEADEMLNMGFRDELESILEQTPDSKNTLLFSATMPKEVMRMASNYMKNPLEITVGKKNAGAENVNHVCYMVQARDRYLALKRIADFYPDIYGIIFCRTRRETQEVADKLITDGYNADSLHGELSQAQRDAVMNKFRIKHLSLLVATDVAARGLDVTDLSHIINYNLPDELEVYTHRSGRTGRAGKTGTSIVIANLKEKSKLKIIEKQINKSFEFNTVPLGKDICGKQLFHLIDRVKAVKVDNKQIDTFLPSIYEKLASLDREELIQKFVSIEFNRFLEYYREAKDLSAPTKNKGGKRSGSEGFSRFFLNLGTTDDLQPTTVIGLIKDHGGVRDIEIGAIDIKRNFSFFEVDSQYEKEILKGFVGKVFKKRPIVVELASKESRKQDQRRKKSSGRGSNEGRYSGKRSSRKGGGANRSRSKSGDSGEKRSYRKDGETENSFSKNGKSGKTRRGKTNRSGAEKRRAKKRRD